MKRFAWDSGETSNFRKTWSKTSCFCTFLKMRFSGAGERGIWGFPQWHLWCHAGLYICIYIMYGFSMQNVLWHIYYDEDRTTVRGDPTRRVGKAEAIAAANFAELRSFRRGWMALRALCRKFNNGYRIFFLYNVGLAVNETVECLFLRMEILILNESSLLIEIMFV